MFSGIASLSAVVGAVADGDGRQSARRRDRARRSASRSGSARWLLAASVPTLAAMVLLPLVLYRLIAPGGDGDAGRAGGGAEGARGARARSARDEMDRRWSTFVGMVALWASAATLGLDSTAIAFLGLGVLLATGVLTLGDIAKEGDVLATFIWFAVLFTLSSQLNELGFMGFLGRAPRGGAGRAGRRWPPA